MIRTEHLLIRRVKTDDWKAIQTIWADMAKSEYARFDMPNDTDDRSVSERVARWAEFSDSDEHIFCVVCLEDDVIGYVAFNRRDVGYETGYCFRSDCHGRGFAKESIGALIEAMKDRGAERITAGTALENTPSVKLLESLGFTLTGTEQVSFYKDEEGRDIFFEGGIFERRL